MDKRKKFTPCHAGPVEVTRNLFCGSAEETIAIAPRLDTLIPLHDLDARIWDLGFRGEVLYYPIRDFGILPNDVLQDLVAKILARLKCNKKVGLFCMGGHGRTGYIASVVLGRLGHEDPIQFLRTAYCENAVESSEQVGHIADVLGRPELTEKYGGYIFSEDWYGLPDYDGCCHTTKRHGRQYWE